VTGEHDVEVTKDGTGKMSSLEGVAAGSAVEVPAHVHDPKCIGIAFDVLGRDEGRRKRSHRGLGRALERGDLVDDVFAEELEWPNRPDVFDAAVRDAKAHRREPSELVDDLVDVLSTRARIESEQHRLFDLVVVASLVGAVLFENLQLVTEICSRGEVARVAVLRDEPERLFSPEPRMRIGGCGRESACGSLSVRASS